MIVDRIIRPTLKMAVETKLKEEISKIFPAGSSIVQVEGDVENFQCHLKLCLFKREDFAEWLDHHSLLSGVKYVMVKTIKEKGCIYNAIYGCRQNKRKPKSTDVSASCKSTLRVTIKKLDPNSKHKTLLRPTTVSLNYCHNHEIFNSEQSRPQLIDDCGFHESLSKLFPLSTKIVFAVRYGNEKEFICRLKVDVKGKEDFNVWLEEHSLLSYVTYRVKKTEAKDKSIYNAYFRCHHNTFPKKDSKPHKKHTNCNATLHVVIREKSDNKPGIYQAKITLNHIHNHDIMASAALAHRDPSQETREKFLSLFRHGVGPAQALHIHHADLKEEYDKDYETIMYDRHICPDRQWVYRLYYSVCDEKQRSSNFQSTIDSLNVQIFNLNSQGDLCAEMKVTEDKDIVIAVCSSFMKRVHLIKSAGEVIFVDSTGNSDRYNFKVVVLMCDSEIGGLPLGVLLMTSEKESTITIGLSMLLNLLPNDAFYYRGKEGPAVFATDDTSSQRISLKHIFPNSKYINCPYRIIQSAWKWVMNKRNELNCEDKVYLFELVAQLISSSDRDTFEKHYAACLNDDLSKKYPSYLKYIEDFCQHSNDKLEEYFVLNLEHHNNNQKSILASAVNVLKECVFRRMKSYHLLQSYEFFSVGYSNYYIAKMLEQIGGNAEAYPQSEYLANVNPDDFDVNKVSEVEVNVVEKKVQSEHTVRADLWFCDCCTGLSCNPCKHQQAVWLKMEEKLDLSSLDDKIKQFLTHIATGQPDNTIELLTPVIYEGNEEEYLLLINAGCAIQVLEPDVNDAEPTLMETSVVEEQAPLDEENFWTEMNGFGGKLLPFFKVNPKVMMDAWKKFSDKVYQLETDSELLAFFESCGVTNPEN